MRIEVEVGIGLADAEIVSYSRDNSDVTVIVEAWNLSTVKITFNDVIGLLDVGIGDITALCQETEATALMSTAIDRMYEKVPEVTPYRCYQFLDLDDFPAMEIIAASHSAVKG
jgi:hypothetical protein